MMKAAYIPFLYFQTTRLNNTKAWLFHSFFEWMPMIGLAIYVCGIGSLFDLALYYLAFISVYEIGYLVNDQLAFYGKGERLRVTKLTVPQIVLFVIIRLLIFSMVTYLQVKFTSPLWWAWFLLLSVQFTAHNLISFAPLKILTFCYLALARFLTPIVFIMSPEKVQVILVPVILNYVIFRMFIYMDSKELLSGFDRRDWRYNVGYYLLLLPFSIYVSLLHMSPLPIAINAYYALVVMPIAVIEHSSAKK